MDSGIVYGANLEKSFLGHKGKVLGKNMKKEKVSSRLHEIPYVDGEVGPIKRKFGKWGQTQK